MDNLKSEQSPHLTEYYHILIKHKSLITASLVITVTLTLLFTFLMKPVFRANTTMVIEKEQSTSPLTGERLDYESYLSQSLTFNTHFKLITSRPILEKVIKDLKLDRLDREQGLEVSPLKDFLSRFGRNVRLLLGQGKKPLTPREELARLVAKLQTKIDIEEVRDTRLLKVSVEDQDPVMARDIANSLARVYIEFNIANRLRSSQNTLSWMTDQLYEMKKRLEDAEEEFQIYKQQEKLFSIKGKQKVITQKIEDFNDAYLETRNKRLELDAKLAELDRSFQLQGDVLHARSLIDNSVIDSLYTQLLDSEVEFSRLSKVFKSKHPKIIQVQSKIDKTRKKLNEELRKEVQNLKTERTVLFDKEKILQKTIADFEKDALETDKKELKYGILERNVETNQKLYDTLLSKIKESDIVGDFDVSNIRITEKGTIPLAPVRPKKKLNFVLSVIFGLMTGIGLAF
ncbi:MAG: GumC family protein, partial [Deltaproteobacteria bacterium]|nr:GumC family protein [Deltaproteobacteria bacterium]